MKVTTEQKTLMRKLLRLSYEGDETLRWLDRAVRDTGYVRMAARRADEPVYVTARKLRSGLNVSERTIRLWLSDGLPVEQPGSSADPAIIEVFAAIAWLLKEGKIAAAKLDDKHWIAIRRREQAHKAERDNLVAEGRLVDRQYLEDLLDERIKAVRERAEAIARAYGAEVEEQLREMLELLASGPQRPELGGGGNGRTDS